jgi:RNA polymerase sigma-70 factor (ECF subfamily)
MSEEARASDDELVKLAKAGRREGFEGLFMRHSKRVFTMARRMLGDDSIAEDVVQDVFLQIFKSLDRFRGASEFTTWLHRITHNTCINRLRSAAVRRASSLDAVEPGAAPASDAPAAEEILGRENLQEQIQRALDRMEPDHRVVLVMRVMDGKSYSEIARLTDQTEDQVRGKLYRARKSFLQHFRP